MTTGAGSAVFIDTNVLVFATVPLSPFHGDAAAALERLQASGVDMWISRQILREFLAALTRPQAYGAPIPAATLATEVSAFESRFLVAEDGPAVTRQLLELLLALPMGGKQIHDANIVATMLSLGIARLLTHNTADFQRFRPLISVEALV